MARTRKSDKNADNTLAAALAGAIARVRAFVAGWPASRWLALAAAVLIPTVLCVGFGRMENYVHGLPRYDRALMLKWEDLPAWLRVPDNRHVLDSLARQVNLRSIDRLLDASLAARLGSALDDPRVGWVKAVERVRVEPSGEVSIKCRFRTPVAWVRHRHYGYLVDDEGVRLPGCYDIADCRGASLLMIEGVAAAPPEVGEPWEGADLASALKLSAMLSDRPFRHQISSILVDNYRGRRDMSRPHIELVTEQGDSRIWWGRPPGEEFGTEISAQQKVTLMEAMYRQMGRIDSHRKYVDVMTWPDRVAMPAVMQAPAQSRLLRG